MSPSGTSTAKQREMWCRAVDDAKRNPFASFGSPCFCTFSSLINLGKGCQFPVSDQLAIRITRAFPITMVTATGRDIGSAKSRKRASDDSADSFPKRPKVGGKTDLTRWRMKDDESRHTWHYLEDDKAAEEWPQSYAEKWYLNLPMVRFSTASRKPPNARLTVAASRTSPLCRKPRHRSNPPRTVLPSSKSFNCPLATGAASTAAPCFSWWALSLLGM